MSDQEDKANLKKNSDELVNKTVFASEASPFLDDKFDGDKVL